MSGSINGNFNFFTQNYSVKNKPNYNYNKYRASAGSGVGASTISNRRAKNRLASICDDGTNNCYAFYNTLGKYKANKNPDEVMILTAPSLNLNLDPNSSDPNLNANPTAPSAPTLVSLVPINNSLVLNFTLGSNGGSAITDIEYSTDNGLTWSSSGATSSPFVISGLTNGTSYQVCIRAINAIGTSPSSNVISGTPSLNMYIYETVGTDTWEAPAGVTSVEYLVVGGGGGSGGGFDTGGGGGGGGGMVLTGFLSVTPGTSYTVTVGDGGQGGTSIRSYDQNTPVIETPGIQGEKSVFGSIEALGGGGGYASRYNSGISSSGGSKVLGSTASTGGSGGGSVGDGNGAGGGGGGASGDGSNGTNNRGGNGGAGVISSISGTSVTYGAGGAGANGNSINAAVAGTANTGNGAKGGGAQSTWDENGAKGGSGIVIIRY